MSDHQFERNVQQKMDEFRLHPSEAVWTNVEKKIRVQKRRRKGLFWIPVLLLLTAVGYQIFTLKEINNSTSTQVATKKTSNGHDITKTNPAPILPKSKSENNEKDNTRNRLAASKSEKELQSKEGHSKEGQSKSNKPQSGSNIYLNPEAASGTYNNEFPVDPGRKQKNELNQVLIINKITSKKTLNTQHSNRMGNKKATVTEIFSPKSLQITAPLKRNLPDSIKGSETNNIQRPVDDPIADKGVNNINNPETKITEDTSNHDNLGDIQQLSNEEVNSMTPSVSIPVQRTKRSWQWGILFHAGVNKIAEGGLLNFENKDMVQVVAAESFSLPLPRNAVIQKPSAISPGMAIRIKGFARKELRKKIHGSLGIGYGLYKTQIRVGELVQSNQAVMTSRGLMDVQGYYRAEQNEMYTNNFHFIEIPLEMEYKLNKKRQMPVSIHIGATYARLISTNALHYDRNTRLYYKDKTLINKNQIGVAGGLSIGLLQSSKHPLTIGSSFHYRLSNLHHRDVFTKKRLLSAGIDVRMLLKKN